MESYRYLGSLKSKIEDALGNRRQLTIEQKQKALELFCQFLETKNLEKRVTPFVLIFFEFLLTHYT